MKYDVSTTFGSNETKVGYIRALVYGLYGSGKTHFIGTAGKEEKVLLLSYDRGEKTLNDENILVWPFEKYNYDQNGRETLPDTYDKTLWALTQFIERHKRPDDELPENPFSPGNAWHGVKVLAFDTLTDLVDMLLYEIAKFNKKTKKIDPDSEKIEYEHYNALKNQCTRILNNMKVASNYGHIICTAGEKVVLNDHGGVDYASPLMTGAIRDIAGHYFDDVYYFMRRASGNKKEYFCYTDNYGNFPAKSRFSMPYKFENPDFSKVLEAYKKGRKDN